jgi:hypothetical protein
MTLPTSGPISIGMAINECNADGDPYGTVYPHAGDYSLSKLAGVTAGTHLQWSYWYGKNLIPPLNNYLVLTAGMNADRYNCLCIDLVNWRWSWSENSYQNWATLVSLQVNGQAAQSQLQGSVSSSTQSQLGADQLTATNTSTYFPTSVPTLNGGTNWYPLNGSPIPDITNYSSLSCSIGYVEGATRTIVSVTLQPSASNGYIVVITWNDDPFSGAAASAYNLYISGTV